MKIDEQNPDSWAELFAAIGGFRDVQNSQRQQGLNDFRVLDSVLSVNDEVRLHTRFIYALLNPKGKHYQGTRFLELFLDCIGRRGWLDSASAIVRKEYCPNGKSEQIDLHITDGTRQIIIENKLNAIDQKRQVIRYLDTVEATDPECFEDTLFIYLTKGRRQPSRLGLGSKEGDNATPSSDSRHLSLNKERSCLLNENGQPVALYQNLWYRKKPESMGIYRWLEACSRAVEASENTSNILWAISDYKAIVERATREYQSNVITLKEFFENDGKSHLEEALQLASDLPSIQMKWLHSVMVEELDELLEDEINSGFLRKLDIDDADEMNCFLQPSGNKKAADLFYKIRYNFFRGRNKNYRDRGVFYLVTNGPYANKAVLMLFYGKKALHAGCVLADKPTDATQEALTEAGESRLQELLPSIFSHSQTIAVPIATQGTLSLSDFEASSQWALFKKMITHLEISSQTEACGPAFC